MLYVTSAARSAADGCVKPDSRKRALNRSAALTQWWLGSSDVGGVNRLTGLGNMGFAELGTSGIAHENENSALSRSFSWDSFLDFCWQRGVFHISLAPQAGDGIKSERKFFFFKY